MKKKDMLLLLSLLSVMMLAGCGKTRISLNAKNITNNIVGIKKDNVIQSAVIEKFDEGYLQEEELEEFIDKEITKYNNKTSDNTNDKDHIVKKSFHVDGNEASVVMNYNSIDDYAEFNSIEAKIYSSGEALSELDVQSLPNFMSYKDEQKVTANDALDHRSAYVLIIREPVEVKVEGTILYYVNAVKTSKGSVQIQDDKEEAIIVYTLE